MAGSDHVTRSSASRDAAQCLATRTEQLDWSSLPSRNSSGIACRLRLPLENPTRRFSPPERARRARTTHIAQGRRDRTQLKATTSFPRGGTVGGSCARDLLPLPDAPSETGRWSARAPDDLESVPRGGAADSREPPVSWRSARESRLRSRRRRSASRLKTTSSCAGRRG